LSVWTACLQWIYRRPTEGKIDLCWSSSDLAMLIIKWLYFAACKFQFSMLIYFHNLTLSHKQVHSVKSVFDQVSSNKNFNKYHFSAVLHM